MVLGAIITAAGKSRRMGGTKKEFLKIDDVPILKKAVMPFWAIGKFKCIVVTCVPGQRKETLGSLEELSQSIILVDGGDSRRESVLKGLERLQDEGIEGVLIHDGARPSVSEDMIYRIIDGVREYGAAIPGVPSRDALKEIDQHGVITKHLQRKSIVCVQTPQGFLYKPLLEAHREIARKGDDAVDDAVVWENTGRKTKVVNGDFTNTKITYQEDLREI